MDILLALCPISLEQVGAEDRICGVAGPRGWKWLTWDIVN